jgi:myosin-light-chain kinase
LHSKNIIHRNITPENIVFKDKNSLEVKLIDFGLAEYLVDPEASINRKGTPGYIAPEIIKC